jgi:hypothetical protein
VVTYEVLLEERAKRAVTDAKEAEKKAKKAARDVASAAPEAEGAAVGMKKRGRNISQVQVAKGGQDLGAPKPSAKTASRGKGLESPSSTATQVEDRAALESWRAPVARMW